MESDDPHRGMRPFKALISAQQAMEMLLPRVKGVGRVDRVALPRALHRVLAADVTAPMDVPPFARAAMDGYAVIAQETFGAARTAPRTFRLVGTLHAGDAPSRPVKPGECIQIATGAKLPPGADAVVRVEDALAEGETVKVEVPVYPARNVSPAGVDIKRGSVVLAKGAVLDPSKIGVLASLGLQDVEVTAKPRVAVLPTGSEVVAPGSPLRDGQIYDSNTFTLTTLVQLAGGEPVTWGSVEDEIEALEAALDRAKEADLVVLSGGSSVGERDLVLDVIRKRGELLFHGVQIKPGKPMLAGVIDGKPLLGFPGYPVSCLTNAYLILVPIIRKMLGAEGRSGVSVRAKMGERLSSSLGRLQILTVRIRDGLVFSTFKESGALTSMAEADGYILIPENVDLVDKGEGVEVFLW